MEEQFVKYANLYMVTSVDYDDKATVIKVVASHSSQAICWYDYDISNNFKQFFVSLVKEGYATVKECFGASLWTEELEKEQCRWHTI